MNLKLKQPYKIFSKISSFLPESSLKNHIKCFIYNKFFSHNQWRISYENRCYRLRIMGIDALFCCNPFSDIEPLVTYLKYWDRNKGGGVIDASAFIGAFTICVARAIGNRGKVLAFEPCVESSKYLTNNVSLNKLDNVQILNYALWDKREVLNLDVSNPHAAFISRSDNMKSIKVQADRLDDILERIGWNISIRLIKMDIEGAELRALKGCEKTIEKWKPTFIIATYHIVDNEPTSRRVENFLIERGYNVETVFPQHMITVGIFPR